MTLLFNLKDRWHYNFLELLGAGLFKIIADPSDQQADYKISITITSIKEVSGAGRVLLGVLAGTNKIEGNVVVTDQKTSQTVRHFSFFGESASHPLSGKSDIRDAIDEAAKSILKGLI